MKYTLQAIQYTLRNLLYLLPIVALPALFLSVSVDQAAIESVVHAFVEGNIHSWAFGDLFCAISVLNFGSLKSIGFGLLGIVALIVCVAMLMAFLEKHMRYGKRTFNGMFSKINDNLLPTLGYAILVLVIYEFWSLLLAALLFFVAKIGNMWVASGAALIILIAMHFALLYVLNIIYLWLPCMQITGFKAAEALQYSNQLSTPAKWHIILAQSISLFIVEALIICTVHFSADFVTFTIVSSVLYALLLIIYCVRMEIVYMDFDTIERRDLKKFY